MMHGKKPTSRQRRRISSVLKKDYEAYEEMLIIKELDTKENTIYTVRDRITNEQFEVCCPR